MRLLKEITHLQDTIEAMQKGIKLHNNLIKDYESKLSVLANSEVHHRRIASEYLYHLNKSAEAIRKFNNLPWYLRLYHFIKEGMYK